MRTYLTRVCVRDSIHSLQCAQIAGPALIRTYANAAVRANPPLVNLPLYTT